MLNRWYRCTPRPVLLKSWSGCTGAPCCINGVVTVPCDDWCRASADSLAALAAAVAATTLAASAGASLNCNTEGERLEPWRSRWSDNQTGWHLDNVNPYLHRFTNQLIPKHAAETTGLSPRVLIPLCGKSMDMTYLAQQGYRVVGIEGVGEAVHAFASEQSVTGQAIPITLPSSMDAQKFRGHAVPVHKDASGHGSQLPPPVLLVEGDFFEIGAQEAEALVPFDAAFDRGSLVAISPTDRQAYAQVLGKLVAPQGKVLLVTVEHDTFSNGRKGPPFEVTEEDVRTLFADTFSIQLLVKEDRLEQDKGMRDRGVTYFRECVYLLTRKGN